MSNSPTSDRPEERQAAFLRKLAHEMRTPLASMLMLAELLADNAAGRLGEREIGYARKIQRAGSEISKLLAAVLDLARIETGAVAAGSESVPLDELVEDLRQIAEEKSIELAVELGDRLPAAVTSDRLQLKRLISHLLDHAARAGSGRADLRFAAAGTGVEVVLSHGGTPIPEAQRGSAFEPFQPGQRGAAAVALPIARALAELLGARLELRGGDSFMLRL